MKKILVTRKLLQLNEDRLKQLYDVKLNSNDELYSQKNRLKNPLRSDTDLLTKTQISELLISSQVINNVF